MDVPKACDLYQKAADMKDPRAVAWQARRMFSGGLGFPKNEEAAKAAFLAIEKELETMATNNLPDAKRSLAFSWGILFPETRGKQAFAILKSLSDQGRRDDLDSLARFYEVGIGVEKTPVAAFTLYKISAEQGNVGAMGSVGYCYEHGIGVAKDEKEAYVWYRRAAQLGNPGAAKDLGLCYEFGKGVEKNLQKAFAAYLQSAEAENSWAQNRVGWCLANGIGVVKDSAKAVEWYRRSADQGNMHATANLGFCYERGQGVPQDEKEAVTWYLKAGDLGNAWAWNQLGLCYENGRGVEKDPKKAFEYYLKSAEAGDSWGQRTVAHAFRNGFGTQQDFAKAFGWYKKSADQGNPEGLENLGLCYARGQGTAQDDMAALKCFQQAAERGSAWAQAETGRYFREGIGIQSDKKIAMDWFRQSANQGNLYAQGMYGKALEEGWNGSPDREEAMRWYQRAAQAGSAWAWAALGQCLEKETKKPTDMKEVFQCYQKANWGGDPWGTRLLAERYALGSGTEQDFALAASLFERCMGTPEEKAARQQLVGLHWGGRNRWKDADLQRGMEHWIALVPDSASRLREIHRTAIDLIKQGRPNAVAEVLDLFEDKQKEEKQPFPDNLKVFRAVCRLMADRQVPKSWNWSIPSCIFPWAEKFSSYFREPDGGKVNVSSGHLEIYQKTGTQFGRSAPQQTADLWEHQISWFCRLLSEEESGWYHSYVRSVTTADRPVNLRWLQAGISRRTDAWKDLADVQAGQLTLGGVAGALLVSRLNENHSRVKEWSNRLDQLDANSKKRKETKKKSEPSGIVAQIRSLTEPGPIVSRWWREKGEVSFGWQATSGGSSASGFLSLGQIPPWQEVQSHINRKLFTVFLQTRPDLILRSGAFLERVFSDPQYSHLGYGYMLDWIYETVASQAPAARPQALEALARWNRAQGNHVTAERWAQTLQEESAPKNLDPEVSKKPRIPEGSQEMAARATRFYEQKKYEEAAAAYQQILDQHPHSLYALSNLGVVRFHQQKYPEAEKALRKAIQISGNDAFSSAVLGIVLVQQEKHQEAVEVLRRAKQLDPQDAKTRNYLGISCSRLGLNEEAERECRKAIELDDKYGDAHFNLAVMYATRTPPSQELARQHYDRALKLGVPKDKDLEKLLP